MLLGSVDDWDGFETFHPETEVCAARVVHPVLEELQVVSLPATLDTKAEQGRDSLASIFNIQYWN